MNCSVVVGGRLWCVKHGCWLCAMGYVGEEFMDSGCLSVVFCCLCLDLLLFFYPSATDPAQIDEHVRCALVVPCSAACALVVPCSAAWKRLCMHTKKPMERIEKRFSCDGSGVQQLYLGGRMVTNSNLGHFTTAAGLFLVRGDERCSCFHHVECCIGTSTRPFSRIL